MVRPVESDPPEPLRPHDPRVVHAHGTPRELGKQRVAEREEKGRPGERKPPKEPPQGDTVILHGEAEAKQEEEHEGNSSSVPMRHLDVEG